MENELPSGAAIVAEDYPEIWDAYARLGKACAESGPLDDRERRLVKLALAIAAGSEGATHSHTRRGLDEGILPEELRQVAMLCVPSLGFPQAVAGLTWVDDILEEDDELDEDDDLED